MKYFPLVWAGLWRKPSRTIFRLQDKDDYARAIADFTQAIRLDPKYVPALTNVPRLTSIPAVHDRALADVAQAIKLDPQNPDAHRLP
jgi:tetratricopeptide (TPR) repeat protein